MWHKYLQPSSIDQVLNQLEKDQDKARVIAGATDLMLEMERGVRKGIETLIDISRIPGLDQIILDDEGFIHLGPLVTHNLCVGSKLLRDKALPLVLAAWEVGSPQIRNRGTIAGNLITASPANDTISPLMALGAFVVLRSSRGERVVSLNDFYLGLRRTVMQPDEMLVDIYFPALQANQRGGFVKFALRRAQAISLVNVCTIITTDHHIIKKAAITLGAVAPTIIHANQAEAFLEGKPLNVDIIQEAASLAQADARPINDVRGTAKYRKNMVRVVARRCLTGIAEETSGDNIPETPVLLMGKPGNLRPMLQENIVHEKNTGIETNINGKAVHFDTGQGKNLLHLLRDEGLLTGTKEGCAEGECGACTVYLDGQAVMSCLVPAPRAHGAEIVTIEGIGADGQLHPIQQAFIDTGAVQCGYCTPGFIMSSVKLLEEKPTPSQAEIRQALTGNLCRCTGYYKIIEAIEMASRRLP